MELRLRVMLPHLARCCLLRVVLPEANGMEAAEGQGAVHVLLTTEMAVTQHTEEAVVEE